MSVKTWKRIITLCVIIIIALLSFKVVQLSTEYTALSEDYHDLSENLNETLNNEFLVDLSEYKSLDKETLDGVLHYLENLENGSTLNYQSKYSSLYVDNDFEFTAQTDEKVCYLTFDDGPDIENTSRILDTLKKYDVKATFFVVYKNSKQERALYKRIVDEGHTIGVHTASHNYSKIYASADAYLKDFERCSRQIESVTGVKPEIFRFPGGSVNTYNSHIYRELIAEMIRRGYTYYDWNTSAEDTASLRVPADSIVNSVVNKNTKSQKKIVLLHDGKGHSTTADALPAIIEELLAQGYKMEALTKEVKPIIFGYYE